MKKILLIILIMLLLIMLCGCSHVSNSITATTTASHAPWKGIITWGNNGVYHIEVEDYIRISSGWIIVTAVDGKQYCTNEKNVLIIKEK